MKFIVSLLAVLGTSVATVASAMPEEHSWSMQVGPAYIDFQERAPLRAGGASVPGATAELENNVTLAAEISYHFTPRWSAGVTLGIPPTSDVTGTGTAQPFGTFGSVRYGPLVVTGQYTFDVRGVWHPYLGAGAGYYTILSEKDGFIDELQVDNAFGAVFQAAFATI